MKLAPEFDPAFYRARHADLASFDDEALRRHYEKHGRGEGRVASPLAQRPAFLKAASQSSRVLEIGPFCNPCMTGRNVRYFDVLDRAGLLKRAAEQGYLVVSAPKIDFVSPVGDLSVVDATFDAVVSSHCIEHQPDLVAHLAEVARILEPGGRYFLLVPDKRFCFDHFLAPSTVAGVLDAWKEGRKVHRLASVLEHRALTTHNDTARHWAGDHADPHLAASVPPRLVAAMAEHEAARGGYVDVHAWQFTPATFREVMGALAAIGLVGLTCERVYDTPFGSNEFTAVLRKTEG